MSRHRGPAVRVRVGFTPPGRQEVVITWTGAWDKTDSLNRKINRVLNVLEHRPIASKGTRRRR